MRIKRQLDHIRSHWARLILPVWEEGGPQKVLRRVLLRLRLPSWHIAAQGPVKPSGVRDEKFAASPVTCMSSMMVHITASPVLRGFSLRSFSAMTQGLATTF